MPPPEPRSSTRSPARRSATASGLPQPWLASTASSGRPSISPSLYSGLPEQLLFAGLAPSSAPAFIAAQVAGGFAGVIITKVLYPAITRAQARQRPGSDETAAVGRLAAGFCG